MNTMKSAFAFIVLICFSFVMGCANSQSINMPNARGPASLLVEKKSTKAEEASAQTSLENQKKFLKLFFAQDGSFKSMSKGDCKAYASNNDFYCSSKDCVAIMKNQISLCESSDCKAIIDDNWSLCTTTTCKALLKDNQNECSEKDTNCKALFNQSYCTTSECEGFLKDFTSHCETSVCKAITKQQLNECEN